MCWLTARFLESGGSAKPMRFADVVRSEKALAVAPSDLVFKEAAAEVRIAQPGRSVSE
jgi:hypothetical protein